MNPLTAPTRSRPIQTRQLVDDIHALVCHEPVDFAEAMADLTLSLLQDCGGQATSTLHERIIAGAVQTIPGTTAAAITTLGPAARLVDPAMGRSELTGLVVGAHNATEQGPCLDAARGQKLVLVSDLSTDLRWPEFAAHMADLQIRSLICAPMAAVGRKLGVITVISDHFDLTAGETPAMAVVLAAHAAAALYSANQVAGIAAALNNRDVIGQAKGVLMERLKIPPHAAFDLLVRTSSRTNLKLRDVAEYLISTGELLPDPSPIGRDRNSRTRKQVEHE